MKLIDSRNTKPIPQVIVPLTAVKQILEKPVISIEKDVEETEMAQAEPIDQMPNRSTSFKSIRGGERVKGLVENEDSGEQREDQGRMGQFRLGREGEKSNLEKDLGS